MYPSMADHVQANAGRYREDLAGDEGLAVKDYAKTQPTVTFLNGASAAQDTTFRDPAPNFFRFGTDGAQWIAGLGTYAFKDKIVPGILPNGSQWQYGAFKQA